MLLEHKFQDAKIDIILRTINFQRHVVGACDIFNRRRVQCLQYSEDPSFKVYPISYVHETVDKRVMTYEEETRETETKKD